MSTSQSHDVVFAVGRLAVGILMLVIGLQLFSGPLLLSDIIWAGSFTIAGICVLAGAAAFPLSEAGLHEIVEVYFTLGRTSDDARAKERAFGRLSWLVSIGNGTWLLLWGFFLSRLPIITYPTSIVPIFILCVVGSVVLLLWSRVMSVLAYRRRFRSS